MAYGPTGGGSDLYGLFISCWERCRNIVSAKSIDGDPKSANDLPDTSPG